MSKKPRDEGFTIVELLLSVSVASIVSVLMVAALVFMYGSLIAEQTRSSMVLESQLFLRRMVEDIRVANEVLVTNTIPDTYDPPGGWLTDDPANILIVTQPAVDVSKDFIYDTDTGYPYQNELIYFGSGSTMYRRTLSNTNATGNAAVTTCPLGTANCPPDVQLTSHLQNLLFTFYDADDEVTADASLARSVELTVNLTRKVYGKDLDVTNTTRMTLRNEN